MWLALWGGMLILVLILFGVSTFIGAVIFGGSWTSGLVVGFVVTAGAVYVLYKLGAYF